jgi:excisionase family DNA binding protein
VKKAKQSFVRSKYGEDFMLTQKALSVEEASQFTGLSKNYLYKLVHLKQIPYYKPRGGRVFFRLEELEAFIFRNRQAAEYEVTNRA